MLKKIFALMMIFGLCAAAAIAEEAQKKESGFSAWLKDMQKKISQIVPTKQPPAPSGVAGVRGAKEEGQAKLYWKGKTGEEAVTEEELAKFKAGIDLADKGDKQGSLKELDEFLKQYPDSALVPDAKKTVEMLKADAK